MRWILGSRFSSNPLIMRVAFFLLLGFKKETPNQKKQKGTTGQPRRFRAYPSVFGFGPKPLNRKPLNPKPYLNSWVLS